jgi:hypothetical protein
MPPRQNSRYSFSRGYTDESGAFVLTDPVPFRFHPYTDNRFHTITSEDSLFTLAAKYFKRFPRPNGLWWIIADFQPDPIHDPTRRLGVGTVLVIPSDRTVQENIFASKRYDE